MPQKKSDERVLETPSYTSDNLKRGMTIAAQLIDRYGPKYWPVLERLKQEQDALDDRNALLTSLLADAPDSSHRC